MTDENSVNETYRARVSYDNGIMVDFLIQICVLRIFERIKVKNKMNCKNNHQQ